MDKMNQHTRTKQPIQLASHCHSSARSLFRCVPYTTRQTQAVSMHGGKGLTPIDAMAANLANDPGRNNGIWHSLRQTTCVSARH